MMEARHRKPGSVRLTDEQYEEMDTMGIDNESAYVKYKLSTAQSKLAVLKTPKAEEHVKLLPAAQKKKTQVSHVEDKLTIQRLVMENQSLKTKLEELDQNNQETLNGVHQRVHSMLQDELAKRDFETLKKSHADAETQIKELEKSLNEANKETNAKQEEIEALVKKMGFVELGKTLLPRAISGLAKQYPNQMKGIAGALGSLGLDDTTDTTIDEEQDHILQILKYLQEVFTEEQFEQVVQLMIQLGEQIKEDTNLLQKISYYLDQLQKKKETNQ